MKSGSKNELAAADSDFFVSRLTHGVPVAVAEAVAVALGDW